MIIGQFCDTFPPEIDGVGMVVQSYANELLRRDEQCFVISPTAPGYDNELDYAFVQFRGLKVPMVKQYRTGIPMLDFSYLWKIKKHKMDILHAHSPFAAGAEAMRLARIHDIPLVGTFHSKYYDDFYQVTKSERLSMIGVKMVLNFFNACDEVWTVNHATADVLHEYGYEKEVFIMPNGTNLWYPTEEDRQLAAQTYHTEGKDVFLFVGQQNWKKNIRCILEALALYKNQTTRPFCLIMVGQGPNMEEIQAFVKECGIEDRVLFTGQIMDREEMMRLYALADLFLFPSVYDNAPMVVREAAAAGTPSILVRGACAAEGITDAGNGFLCDNSPQSLCETLCRIVENKELLQRVGGEARNTIPVSWKQVIDLAMERYTNLVEKHAHREITLE